MRSRAAPVAVASISPAGAARTPAAQMIVRAGSRSTSSPVPSPPAPAPAARRSTIPATSRRAPVPRRRSMPATSISIAERPGQDVDAQSLQIAGGVPLQLRREARQDGRPGVHQDDARLACRDVAKVAWQDAVSKGRDLAGQLDAGRTRADHDEGEPGADVRRGRRRARPSRRRPGCDCATSGRRRAS